MMGQQEYKTTYNPKKVPGLVNPSMLKDGKDGTQRLNGTMRKKMGKN